MNKGLYLGVMSGTSADGIDAVLAEISNNSFSVIDSASISFPNSIKQEIKALSRSGEDEIHRAATLGIRLSQFTSELINTLLKHSNIEPSQVCAIGYHGQTIRHHPDKEHAYSVQIGCPSTLTFKTDITTITDFRMADIVAGGQGAPLVPAFHQSVFHSPSENRFIVNIGGIANITFIPSEMDRDVIGFDTGPGNTLLDEWIYLHKSQAYDESGSWASSGQIIPELLIAMMNDPYILKPLPKSTGKEHFNLNWLHKHLAGCGKVNAEDIQRTLVEFTAQSIASGIKQISEEYPSDKVGIYICGGGINNSTLVNALQNQLPESMISSTEQLGIHPQLVEGAAFAWLAHQTLEGKPGNLPSVTGAVKKRILGGIYLR